MTLLRKVFLSSLVLALHCTGSQVRTPDPNPNPYREVAVEVYVSSRVGLKLRKNHDLKAPVIKLLPLNQKLSCSRETNFSDRIDSFTSSWLFCTSGKAAGWVFSKYTDEELSIEGKRDNLIQSVGNDVASIELILLKSGLFKLKFLSLLNKDSQNYDYLGRWRLEKNLLLLAFEGETTGEEFLFFLPNGKPITDMGNQISRREGRVYSIELAEPSIMIWGVRCVVKKIML